MKWSPFQEAIFDFCQDVDAGNAIVEAVAGSGKTTTIVEALRRIEFTYCDTLFLAFNKSIAEELKSRGVNARTFHSLTYGPVTRYLGVRKVSVYKTRNIINSMLNSHEAFMYRSFIERLVSLGKQMGIGVLCDDTVGQWVSLVNHHNLEPASENASVGEGIAYSREVFNKSKAHSEADFDDLLYFAAAQNITLPKFDFIFVDEAQDTNAIQRAVLRKAMHSETRIVAVGDPAQAIYGFRGSDSNSLNLIAEEFNAKRLPLTVSYRCPQQVVAYAQQWVSHIQSAPEAPQGQVLERPYSFADIRPGDMVVSRTVKPLIAMAYRMLKAGGVAPHVLGREIGIGLKTIINKMNACDLDGLELRLLDWCTRETGKFIEQDDAVKLQDVEDKYESICFLIDGLAEDERTIDGLLNAIDRLFADKANSAMLCTIHKAKGLESERVYWINGGGKMPPWAQLEWQKEQERNLFYVAATRAKETLIIMPEK